MSHHLVSVYGLIDSVSGMRTNAESLGEEQCRPMAFFSRVVTRSAGGHATALVRPLTEPRFRLQFAAQATSVVGDYMVPVALAFAVFSLDSSPSALGVVLAAYSASLVVFVPIGGVWADRLPRNRVMVAADLARFAAQGAAAGL